MSNVRYSWGSFEQEMKVIKDLIDVRDSLPGQYDASKALAEEMTKDILRLIDILNKRMNEYVIIGVEDDVPF